MELHKHTLGLLYTIYACKTVYSNKRTRGMDCNNFLVSTDYVHVTWLCNNIIICRDVHLSRIRKYSTVTTTPQIRTDKKNEGLYVIMYTLIPRESIINNLSYKL